LAKWCKYAQDEATEAMKMFFLKEGGGDSPRQGNGVERESDQEAKVKSRTEMFIDSNQGCSQ
jgi:hypothetical protein